jgi:hypothetical protein
MVHGTNYILPQLQYSHFVVKQIRTLFKDLVGDDTKKFIRDLGLNLDSGYHQIQPRPKSSISLRVLATTWLLGLSKKRLISPPQKIAILNFCGPNAHQVTNYRRIFLNKEKGGLLVHGTTYLRDKGRMNSVVAFNPNGDQDEINFFCCRSFHHVLTAEGNTIGVVVLGRLLHQVDTNFANLREGTTAEEGDLRLINKKFQEVHPVAENQELMTIDAQWIVSLCAYVHNSYSDRAYTIQRWNWVFDEF